MENDKDLTIRDELINAALTSNEAFSSTLKSIMRRMGITAKDLSEGSGIPLSTINKILSECRDLRLSTLRDILRYLHSLETPPADIIIGVIAARPSLDAISKHQLLAKGKRVIIKEYPALTIEDAIISAIKAEREHVNGLVCASIVASIIEKFVRIPIATIKVEESNILDSVHLLVEKITSTS
ncbi:MAG: helix-turn-helix domain-containing protein [Candidatus Methanomethylicaceae archaeon]